MHEIMVVVQSVLIDLEKVALLPKRKRKLLGLTYKSVFIYMFCLVLIILSSCTVVHQGMITALHPINKSDVVYVDEAVGYSKIHYFIGFGGYRTASQVHEAKQKLFANYPLSKGESFENLILPERKTFFPFITRSEVFVFSDVVRRDTNYSITLNDAYLEKLKPRRQDNTNFFKINQRVIFKGVLNNHFNATIINFNHDKRITLLVHHPNKIKVRNVTQDMIFSKEDQFGELSLGEDISFLTGHNLIDTGTLIGLNPEYGLVQTEKRAVKVELKNLIKKNIQKSE
ncbi:MAG: hypothetical protein JJT77_01855 [Crocinitomicaceae bacterium]|nr:hypothetical protein [Crocinitomicaceae bacterium]